MFKKIIDFIKKQKKIILAIIIIIGVSCLIKYIKEMKKEDFEEMIDQDERKYDDALEKRIAEVKEEAPRYDAELLLSVNKPYEQTTNDGKGWWSEVVQGKGTQDIYTKEDSDDWIFPY
jgi:hypothetical protein